MKLTPRRIKVLRLLCEEYESIEISEKTGFTIASVNQCRAELKKLIGCKNVVGMVKYAIKEGIYTI
jgi:DNA-binding NarL/FixJ family response regulator